MSVRVWAQPTLILFSAAVVFAGIAARRSKQASMMLIFLGLMLLLLGMMSLQIAYAILGDVSPFDFSPVGREAVVPPLLKFAEWLPVLSGLSLATGFALLARPKNG